MERRFPKIIFFYIVRETLFAFLVCFLFFFFIFFVNQILYLAQDVLSKRVPPHQVALLIFFSMPSIVALASPFASLTGTLMTVGRLSSDNEILVLAGSGFSYRSVYAPALLVGLFISIFSFAANDILLPAGTVQFSRLYRRILFSTPALELEANSIKRFKNTLLVTGPVEGNVIRDVLIMDRTGSGERRLILAKNAGLSDLGGGNIGISLESAFVQSGKENVREDYDYASSSSLRYIVPQDEIIQTVYNVGPREMSSVDVKKEIRQKEITVYETLEIEKFRLAGRALKLEALIREGSGDRNGAAALASEYNSIAAAVREIENDRSLLIYRLEYFKKFAIPFGALSFVLLAVSIGLMAKRSGQTIGFLIGLVIAALYWAALLIGQAMGTDMGFSPFWSMWFPNAAALVSGFILAFIRIRA
ncbi:MAG: LptF/LptG family permease [Treponema sp.]|jgi:lipopolysaccharide export system permease protein|nr:LptF/LptG family permease [Treponema sp.]